MSTAKLPLTVAAAMAAGWTSIQAECPGHQISQIPWTMIAGGRERALASIVRRLRCIAAVSHHQPSIFTDQCPVVAMACRARSGWRSCTGPPLGRHPARFQVTMFPNGGRSPLKEGGSAMTGFRPSAVSVATRASIVIVGFDGRQLGCQGAG